MDIDKEVDFLSAQFKKSQEILIALGDETRQHLILEMMKTKQCNGLRVVEIAAFTNLSRPAVSHHLQILKKAGVVKMRREGTKNYYYFDTDLNSINNLIQLLEQTKKLMLQLPNRNMEM
ncbi:ArsR/SmtB family transcription factor [Mycoplasma sp. P36-A1]|uniref:ArsR/SmtB family transcription factor n=1 Tax=Mycoplasma sp. P36-A1 TaxID=3252900 RepID=UPI003C2D81BE